MPSTTDESPKSVRRNFQLIIKERGGFAYKKTTFISIMMKKIFNMEGHKYKKCRYNFNVI